MTSQEENRIIALARQELEKFLGNPEFSGHTTVKPQSFNLTEVDNDPGGYTRKRESQITAINARLLDPLPQDLQEKVWFEEDETHYDAEFFPVSPDFETLIHTTSIAPSHRISIYDAMADKHIWIEGLSQAIRTGTPVSPWDYKPLVSLPPLPQIVQEHGIIGNTSEESPTYLKTSDVPEHAPCGGFTELSMNLHLEVNVAKLLESRHIFYDPETLLSGEEEYMKTFLVFGGIPNQAVVGFQLEYVE